MSEINDYSLNVTRDDFSKLLILLKVFENQCNDCDIREGLLRCRTVDRQAVISMNLSSILEQNPLQFTLIKNKIGLLKSFELDDNIEVEDKNIIIESNESNYEIKDPFSKMIFRKPLEKYIDNKYISDAEFNSMIQCNEEDLVFTHKFTHYLKKRISSITLGFQSDMIKCQIIDGKGYLSAETRNHDDSTKLGVIDTLNDPDISDCEFVMISMPFLLDVISELKLDVYKTNSGTFMCKFHQNFYGVDIDVYTQVAVKPL
jgi:hypothetical protein